MTNVVLIEIEGGIASDPINVVGRTDVILIDWDMIDMNGSMSLSEAMRTIGDYKVLLYPWREKYPAYWDRLYEIENDWLEGAESDARLTYPEVD